jgi:hypothetical protein
VDPDRISDRIEDDPERENRRLMEILRWVRAYRACPDRQRLEAGGFHFPPVDPDIDPDSDWVRFERWMRGEALSWDYEDEFGVLEDPDAMSDGQVKAEVERIMERLASRNVVVTLNEGVPDRVAYLYLRRELREGGEFDFAGEGTFAQMGCSAHCPSCHQRPWCDSGAALAWVEDEEARRMVVPDEVLPHLVDPLPTIGALRDRERAAQVA